MTARREERAGECSAHARRNRPEARVRVAPSDPAVDWLMGKAEAALRQGQVDEALPFIERALDLARDPSVRVVAHALLGSILRDRDELGRSLVHFRAAADLAPERSDVLYQLGLAHAHQENTRAAAEILARAHELAPRDPEIMRALGVALAGIGDDGAASRLLQQASEEAPEELRVLESLAMHHLKMGRFAECGNVVQRASAIAPDNPIVRRLAKEANYLVELATAGPPERDAGVPVRKGLRVALAGAAGDVERLFATGMAAAGFAEAQVAHARDAWRDYLAARGPRMRGVAEHAAAVEFMIARMDFVDGCPRDQVARRYDADEAAVARIYEEMVAALDIAVFDRRYSTQRHPVEQVNSEASRSGLEAEEVFQALLEDEFREYEEAFDRTAPTLARLGRDEFEDASVEYGSLLTREMMGLTLGKRDRRRKRELEKILLVS